jgi:hypothetical protein
MAGETEHPADHRPAEIEPASRQSQTASGAAVALHNQTSPLLSLPGEIRNRIYRFALVASEEEGAIELSPEDYLARKQLLYVCKQIRVETEKIFYVENVFAINVIGPQTYFGDRYNEVVSELRGKAAWAERALRYDSNILSLSRGVAMRFGAYHGKDRSHQRLYVLAFRLLCEGLVAAENAFRYAGIPRKCVRWEAVESVVEMWDQRLTGYGSFQDYAFPELTDAIRKAGVFARH